MKRLLLLLLPALLAAQTAQFPGAVATDANLKVAGNNIVSKLSSSMGAADTAFTMANVSGVVPNMLLTIGTEILSVNTVAGNVVSATRAFDGTTAVAHPLNAPVSANWDAWHWNSARLEIEGIEGALGANLSNLASQTLGPAAYNFATAPGGTLSTGTNILTYGAPAGCPKGVNGTDINHYLYATGGTGAAESMLITSGTCTSGAASGTLVVTAGHAHSGPFTVGSASGGLQEALFQANAGVGGRIVIPQGGIAIHAMVSIPSNLNFGAFIIEGNNGGSCPGGCSVYRAADYPAGDIFFYDQSLVSNGGSAITMRDFSIYNAGPFGSRVHNTSGAAIHVRGNTDFPFHVENLNIDSGFNPINIDSSGNVVIDRCTIGVGQDYTFASLADIQLTYSGVGALPEAKITNNDIQGTVITFSQAQFGILVNYADGLQISGNHFGFLNTGVGFPVNTGSQIDIVTISDNEFDTCALNCIGFFNAAAQTPLLIGPITIEGNDISAQVSGSFDGISVGTGSAVDGLQILGNRIYRNGLNGIHVQTGGAAIGPVQIIGNAIFDNNVSNTFAAGILLEDTAPHDYTITGNSLYNSRAGSYGPGQQNDGILISHGLVNSLVSANNFRVPAGGAAQVPIAMLGPNLTTLIANNAGIDDVIPAVASAATFAFPLNPRFTITGTTGVTALTMSLVSPGASGSFRTTGGAVTFTAGGGIGNTLTTTANVPVLWSYDGTSVWLK